MAVSCLQVIATQHVETTFCQMMHVQHCGCFLCNIQYLDESAVCFLCDQLPLRYMPHCTVALGFIDVSFWHVDDTSL